MFGFDAFEHLRSFQWALAWGEFLRCQGCSGTRTDLVTLETASTQTRSHFAKQECEQTGRPAGSQANRSADRRACHSTESGLRSRQARKQAGKQVDGQLLGKRSGSCWVWSMICSGLEPCTCMYMHEEHDFAFALACTITCMRQHLPAHAWGCMFDKPLWHRGWGVIVDCHSSASSFATIFASCNI